MPQDELIGRFIIFATFAFAIAATLKGFFSLFNFTKSYKKQ